MAAEDHRGETVGRQKASEATSRTLFLVLLSYSGYPLLERRELVLKVVHS